MRGSDTQNTSMWSTVQPEQRVPQNHPLRSIRTMVNRVLQDMSCDFTSVYSAFGRTSIPPEHLLRALLLQILFSVRSERMLMEQLNYNLLFRWFVGLGMDDAVWDVTVFTKNRERFLNGNLSAVFFSKVLDLAREANLMSDEHFSVDGTLIEAWASHKSFRPKDGPPDQQVQDLGEGGKNPTLDFHGERRSNVTHASITDPDARLAKKSSGGATLLAYSGHVLMENRNGLAVAAVVKIASGTAEWEAGIEMTESIPGNHRATLGADKKYDYHAFVAELRERNITPHVAQNLKAPGGSSIDGRTTSHIGYEVSGRKRKLIEEIFGWGKTVGQMRKTKLRGTGKVDWNFRLNVAAYNLVRMVKLLVPQPT